MVRTFYGLTRRQVDEMSSRPKSPTLAVRGFRIVNRRKFQLIKKSLNVNSDNQPERKPGASTIKLFTLVNNKLSW